MIDLFKKTCTTCRHFWKEQNTSICSAHWCPVIPKDNYCDGWKLDSSAELEYIKFQINTYYGKTIIKKTYE